MAVWIGKGFLRYIDQQIDHFRLDLRQHPGFLVVLVAPRHVTVNARLDIKVFTNLNIIHHRLTNCADRRKYLFALGRITAPEYGDL